MHFFKIEGNPGEAKLLASTSSEDKSVILRLKYNKFAIFRYQGYPSKIFQTLSKTRSREKSPSRSFFFWKKMAKDKFSPT